MVEGIQYEGGISSIFTISMKEVHHQYSGGYAVWTCHIILQYMTTRTAQGVVGDCVYLEK